MILTKNIVQLFAKQANDNPHNIAVTFKNKHLTYQQLNKKANLLARHLQAYITNNTPHVAIYLERSLELVISIIAILKANSAYIPIDTNYPEHRIQQITIDANPCILLTTKKLLHNLQNIPTKKFCLDTEWHQITKNSPQNIAKKPKPSSPCYIIYTSGSTGEPKGVINIHKGLMNRIYWMQQQYKLTKTDVVLQKTPYSFDVSVWEFVWPLISGAQLTIAKPNGHNDPKYLQNIISQSKITTLHFVPSMLKTFISNINPQQCRSIKRIICSGEELSWQTQQDVLKKLNIDLYNLYGPTEASIDVTYWHCNKNYQDQKVPIGKPITNTKIYILDNALQMVPIGITGELYIGGDGLALGYLNQPELTKQRFIKNPFSSNPKSRLYKTGDLAKWLPDGNIEYLGRIDDQVKIRGFRIELNEITNHLQNHPQISQATTLAKKDREGYSYLAAYLIPKQQKIDLTKLRNHLKQYLPEYMLPSIYIQLDKFPITQNGKIDKRALLAINNSMAIHSKNIQPPSTIEEQMLCTIWAKALDLTAGNISIHDDFFTIGGHSLLAMQIVIRINNFFGCNLKTHDLFKYSTIAKLAAQIPKKPASKSAKISSNTNILTNTYPASYNQQRIWFLSQLEPKDPLYYIAMSFSIIGELNYNSLKNAFLAIITRHEALRTTFIIEESQIRQKIIPIQDFEFILPIVDLTKSHKNNIDNILYNEGCKHFDLINGNLIRTKILKLEENQHILYIGMHHLVTDGWSERIFNHELTALYNASVKNRPLQLTPLPVQYHDFATWQNKHLNGSKINRQLNYWRKQLNNFSTLNLPNDYPRPKIPNYKGKRIEFKISKNIVNQLNQLAATNKTTLFNCLLSAFNILLAKYSGQKDIIVGTTFANRQHAELEQLIGFFANTIVLRSDLSRKPTFLELLKRNKKMTTNAYANQDVPFEKVVKSLLPLYDRNSNPIFQTMITFEPTNVKKLKLTGLKVKSKQIDLGYAMFDLTLFLQVIHTGLFCTIEYNTELFKSITIERMITHFKTLLQNVLQNSAQSIANISILPKPEYKLISHNWNQTKTKYPHNKTIVELFEEQAERYPTQIAVTFNSKALTYNQLNKKSNMLAKYLQSYITNNAPYVAIYLDRSLELVISIIAILKASSAYIPIDTSYPEHRIQQIITDAKPCLLLTAKKLLPNLQNISTKKFCLDTEWHQIAKTNYQNLVKKPKPNSACYIIYTSGSTGEPKGVINIHKGLMNRIYWMQQQYKLTRHDVVLQKTPYSFDVSAWEFVWPLISGAQLTIAKPNGHKDPEYLQNIISQKAVTTLHFVPSMLKTFISKLNPEKCRSIKRIICSGEKLSWQLQQDVLSKLSVDLYNLYGPTEASIDVTSWHCSKIPYQDKKVPIGKPIANTKIYILDNELQVVPIGITGELYIGGDGLALGYLNQP
ncbi:MAG: amino acid adenylation domain-containing protein, partial [Gammaproteobacteria bacterium]|nr:amino acid adenylation domain-containing protein [Gammaproteobacteria bacterium]